MSPMAVSAAVTLAMLSTVAFSPSLAASIGKQNRIRLVNGFTENEGIVEIQRVETLNNAAVGVTWATVCVHTWTKKIGEVACRQLGYEDFGMFPSVSQFTTLGHRRVALKVKSCKGSEQSLESCETVPFHSQLNCSHQHDLAVLCAKNGTVRFRSSPAAHSGVVQAYIEGAWRHVCPYPGNSSSYVCGQLGYSTATPSEVMSNGGPHTTYSPDWDSSDRRCQANRYSTEGCVWYQSAQRLCNQTTNRLITCSGPPGKVAQPSVFAISSTSARVNWKSVDDRNSPLVYYTIVYWKTEGGRNNASNVAIETVPASRSVGTLDTMLKGLMSDTVYSIEIAGVSEHRGPGEFSEPVTFKMPMELKRPPTPADLKAVVQPGGAVDITYKIPSSKGSVKLVEAHFWAVTEGKTNSSGSFVTSPIHPQGKVLLRGLLPSTNYTARLRVLSEINGLMVVGDFSDVSFITLADNTNIMVIKTHVNGSTVLIDWKLTPSGALSPRQRRQSAQTEKPLALSINCSFPSVNQVRSYFWWSPAVGETLTMESLPLGADGTCSAALYTHEGQGQWKTFTISTEAVAVEDSLALLPPLVSERDVTIEWMLPRNIAPRQTKVVVWKASDVSAAAATEHIVQSRSDTKMNLVLNPGEVYVYMLLVDVIGGGRLQSNPVHFRMPKGISTPHPPIGTVEGNGTSLSVRWTTTEGATGYIVMATSYTGRLRNETLMKVVFGPANGTAGLSLSTLIPFNVECSSKFTFKVAAFNNFGMGPYTDETEVRIRHKNCDSFSAFNSSQDQMLVFVLLGILIAVVVILVCVGAVTLFCLVKRNYAKRNKKRMIADGPLGARTRRSTRGSVRYIGVHKVKTEEEKEEGKGEKEKELKSRPLPIPTESDLEDEEEEAEARACNDSHLSFNASGSKVAPTEPGYSTIPSDVRESIIQSAHKTSMDHLKEQGYEMVRPTPAHYQSPRSLSPQSPNMYNVPREPSPVGEYECPLSSRSQSPSVQQSRHAVRAQSAPHPLTYDVPPSRVTPEVSAGQYGIPSASNHLYGNVSNPQFMSAGSGGQVPATYDVLPPRSSPSGNATYDVPRSPAPGSIPAQHQNGYMDSTYDKPSSIPATAGTPRLVPRIQEPGSTYDVPSSRPAKNENNYDVLPRGPQLSIDCSQSPSSTEDPPQVLTTPKRSRRFNLPSPTASPDMNSAHPTNEGFYSVPRPSQGKEGYYDVLPKRPVVVEVGQPAQNVEGYYDTPSNRPVADAPVLLEEENISQQSGQSEESEGIPADTSFEDVPVAEGSPKSKFEHPYSKVKRLISSDGKQQKVTVMEDSEGDSQDLQTTGSTGFFTSGSLQTTVMDIARENGNEPKSPAAIQRTLL